MKNKIINTLQSHDFYFNVIRDNLDQVVIKMGIGLENGRCDTYIDKRPEQNQVLIYTHCPTIVPFNQRLRISEFITRANHNLIIGNFEMDFEDGELRYKATYFYEEVFNYSEEIFLKNLFTTFHLMDRYLPGIMSVIYAIITPLEAINQIENIKNPYLN